MLGIRKGLPGPRVTSRASIPRSRTADTRAGAGTGDGVTGHEALTSPRPPRESPPAVPSERLRIAPPPTQPPPPHTSIIQLLFPVVGGVGMVGFALVYRNTLFLYIAGAMILLLLLFSIGMRWSQ